VSFAAVISITMPRATDYLPRWAAWILLAALLPGLVLAQPNGFISLLVISVVPYLLALWTWVRAMRAMPHSRLSMVGGSLAFAAIGVAAVAVFVFARPPRSAANWQPTAGIPHALVNIVLNAQLGNPSVAISVLVAIGVIVSLTTRRNRWLVACLGVLSVFYVAVVFLP